jgi:hypothetical protein
MSRHTSDSVHFDRPKDNPEHQHSHIHFDWLKLAKKDLLIDTIVKKKWSSRNKSELQKEEVDTIRKKMKYYLQQYGTMKDAQSLEERVMKEKQEKESKKEEKVDENRKRKEYNLTLGQHYGSNVGSKLYVFDKKVTNKHGQIIESFDPIRVKVSQIDKTGKILTIQFTETRKWNESGSHWVYKGDHLDFKFDPITCKWLRSGLTAEAVRSIGKGGKSVYFELSYTQQYLVFPEELTQKS